MTRGGIPTAEGEPYPHAPARLTDTAQLLARTPEALAAELVDTMLRGGAIALRDGQPHATAEHTPVAAESPRVPCPPGAACRLNSATALGIGASASCRFLGGLP